MINTNDQLAVVAAGNGDVSTFFGRFAKLLRSSVSNRAISVRSAALILAATAPLSLSSTSASAACIETAVGSGIFACTGADLATLSPASAVGGDLVVTTTAPFSVIAGAGHALELINAPGDVNISFTDNNVSSVLASATRSALSVDNNGTGATSIVVSGKIYLNG